MLVIKPFAKKYLEDAATLFVSTYRLLREKCPILPDKYENREVIIPVLIFVRQYRTFFRTGRSSSRLSKIYLVKQKALSP